MTDQTKSPQEEKVACEICLTEIPISESKSEEASDYVRYFCGLECYDKWKQQNNKKEN